MIDPDYVQQIIEKEISPDFKSLDILTPKIW